MKHRSPQITRLPIITVATCALAFLAGCASPKYNHQNKITEISEPNIGVDATASVGDSMLRQGKYEEKDAIYVTEDVKVSVHYHVRKGYYIKQGADEKWEYYYPSPTNEGGRIDKLFISDPPQALARRVGTRKIAVVTVLNAVVGARLVSFREEKLPSISENNFQQTLIYNGMVGEKINIGYREYFKDLARPAFSNEVEYDLAASHEIGYKGAIIDIVEATNRQIRYRVRKNFNTPGTPDLVHPSPMGTERGPKTEQYQGTGFAVTKFGHIVTNYHVVEGSESIQVTLADKSIHSATLLKADRANDLAILKIETDTHPLRVGGDQRVVKAQEIVALGFPRVASQGEELKVTTGRINSLSGIDNDFRHMQMDAAIQPGNSGGPLLSRNGSVIGIVTATLSPLKQLLTDGSIPQSVNYALKIDYLLPLISEYGIESGSGLNDLSVEEVVSHSENGIVLINVQAVR